ncbi:hypothetical protein [Massilia rubra]|uniref:Uncharacterized protein n=1 Tax=Massilia rubra TaxID=2607910 RepID=A0ABX0LTX2_9BURK|nr:hypothetical protein [Massilia rubra]NHZ35332.1 hypothetical protein [Massilia rubra]
MMVTAMLLSINQSSYHMVIDTTNDSWRALRLVRLPADYVGQRRSSDLYAVFSASSGRKTAI